MGDALNCEAAETKPALAARAPLVLKAADNERRFEFEERKKRRAAAGRARLAFLFCNTDTAFAAKGLVFGKTRIALLANF